MLVRWHGSAGFPGEVFAMQIAGLLLGCLLLGAGPTTGHPVRSSEIVAEALRLPTGSTLAGQPLTLLAALRAASDRSQQLQIVRTYWRLTQAAAEYHFCFDYAKTLERMKMASRGDPAIRSAEASATAQLREAELAAIRLQYELAELVRQPAGSPLPLPSDRPLVVPYRTSFKELFANRTPPEPARLADRVLPLQRQAIDDRAAAVQAAADAFEAVTDDLQAGRGNVAAVTTCSRELLRQQRAFIETVCGYNRSIADYALMVVGPAVSSEQLAAILIGPPQPSGGSSQPNNPSSSADSAVRSTGANEPIGDNPMRRSPNQPTLAPPQSRYEPTPAPPRDEWDRNKSKQPSSPDGLKPLGKHEPPLENPRSTYPASPPASLDRPATPLDALPPATPVIERTANKPRPAASIADAAAAIATPLYPALVTAQPGARAKQLTLVLHWDRSLPEGVGKPLSLPDCLQRDGSADRCATIAAYWLVRQRAAQYQLLAGQAELLESLSPVVLERYKSPSGPADGLRLHAAQRATQAMMREAHVALVEAQYALALRIGAVAEADWPLASTSPHSGSYLLKLDAQPPALTQSWAVRRLAATVPGLSESVLQRAAAVVDADTARVAAAERYASRLASIDQLLDSVAGQTEQTSAFLESLTAYNRAIAEYAVTVLPPGVPPAKLAAALVAKP
jgi:hypothetical protein